MPRRPDPPTSESARLDALLAHRTDTRNAEPASEGGSGVADLSVPHAAARAWVPALPGDARPDRRDAAIHDTTAPDAAVPDDGVRDAAVRDAAVRAEGVPDDAVPDDAVPDNGVPDDAVPHDAVPDNGVPDDGAPDDVRLDAVRHDDWLVPDWVRRAEAPPAPPPGLRAPRRTTSRTTTPLTPTTSPPTTAAPRAQIGSTPWVGAIGRSTPASQAAPAHPARPTRVIGPPPSVGQGERVRPSTRDPAATAAALGTVRAGYAATHGDPLTRVETPRRRVRWRVTWRAAGAGALALALVAGAVAVRAASVSAGESVSLPVPAPEGTPASAVTAPATSPSASVATSQSTSQSTSPSTSPTAAPAAAQLGPLVVVHVIGAVHREGLVRLPSGSRVADAIDAAGGATSSADLDAVNLARVLVDGEQVVVPRHGETVQGAGQGAQGVPGATGDASVVAPAPAAMVDLNTADEATLDGLPGVGPVLAGRIVEYRGEHPFTSVDQLEDVPGIGPAMLTRLRDLVRV